MILSHLRVNHLENPLGFDVTRPTFSFVVEKSTGKMLKWARIRVSTHADLSCPCYDSGERADLNGLAFTPDAVFDGGVRYYWQVSAMADDGDYGASDVAWFEGGRAQKEWDVPFITSPWDEKNPATELCSP